jgi:general L-amino acid transport system substrate-binding protein
MRVLILCSALLCGVTFHAAAADAAYRMCAQRAGPQGPCTCKGDGDTAGQFTVVAKSLCRRNAARARALPPAGAVPVAGTAPAGTSPIETSQLPADAPAAGATAAAAEAVPAPAPGGRLAAIRARGKLLCGVNPSLLGFSAQSNTGDWAGLDVDFCRAVATAVFGAAAPVEFVPIETSARFEALTSGRIDILARNTTWTMNRDVDLGLEFAGILYFDGQGFLTSEERGLVSAQQLSGAKVCVEAGTTSEQNMAFYFKAHAITAEVTPYAQRAEMLKDYLAGACDAVSGDHSALSSDRAGFPEPSKHAVLPEVISKEPLGPAVLGGDAQWARVVRWTLAGLINAEEVGLDKATAAAPGGRLGDDAQRLVDGAGASGEKLGLAKTWLRDVVAVTGNYGEMFEANVGKQSPLGMPRGINALWKKGGLLYSPPMW